MTKISCVVEYLFSPHLSQIYKGFQILEEKGLIDLKFIKKAGNLNKPIISAFINNEYHIIYDTLDGFNWLDNKSIEDNLLFFQNHYQCDYYFKRSYNASLLNYNKGSTRRIHNLEFNYDVAYEPIFTDIKRVVKDTIHKRLNLHNPNVDYKDFEYYFNKNDQSKILFSARLWDPKDVENIDESTEREIINQNRINYIRACKKEFGSIFTGGLQDSELSRKMAKDLVLSNKKTSKLSYIRTIKDHDICISTLGLHKSNGWKFGEYIAASRAIISEPLFFTSENFIESNNYLEVSSTDSLISNIYRILDDTEYKYTMMVNNFNYYNQYLRPDALILNSLIRVINN